MEQDAKDQISDDTILDEAHDCQDCANARLIKKQSEMIAALDLSRAIKDKRIEILEEQLEIERGRNRVLGFQIRTLREGKL